MNLNMNAGGTSGESLFGVKCDVLNCEYNTQHACCAKEIKVGPQFAATSTDTICATFRPKS